MLAGRGLAVPDELQQVLDGYAGKARARNLFCMKYVSPIPRILISS